MSGIYISYRRQDPAGHATRMLASLREHFDEGDLLMGEQVRPGGDFAAAIERIVGSCDVLLAVIGPDWVTAADGRPGDPRDVTRLEIAAALQRGVRVIPVLVGGAELPRSSELPEALARLSHVQALELRDAHWEPDARKLVDVVERLIRHGSARVGAAVQAAEPPPPPTQAPPPARAPAPAGRPRGSILAALARLVRREKAHGELRPRPRGSPIPSRPLPDDQLARARHDTAIESVARPADRELHAGDIVDCSVFAPPRARAAELIFVQVFAHALEDAAGVLAIAQRFDKGAEARAVKSLASPIPRDTVLTFELLMPGAQIDEPVQSLVWRRRPESVQFAVSFPPASAPGARVGTVRVRRDMWPVGHVKFKLDVEHGDAAGSRPLPAGDDARRYSRAFLSYASGDRPKVLDRVQMLRVLEIDYFQDLLALEPGDRWERRLYDEIERSDLFILFWSNLARTSEWVRRETRYALTHQASDAFAAPEICPVLVEGPPVAPPWEELAHLHFNDALLYLRAGHR